MEKLNVLCTLTLPGLSSLEFLDHFCKVSPSHRVIKKESVVISYTTALIVYDQAQMRSVR